MELLIDCSVSGPPSTVSEAILESWGMEITGDTNGKGEGGKGGQYIQKWAKDRS